jgi:ABC-type branched-subunit amino acid transport system ATPase component
MQDTILKCQNVVKIFGGLLALDGATLSVQPGEILGLVGPNGSGKTTLINVISGQYQADSGDIFFQGERINTYQPNQLAHLGIARTYQIPRPFSTLSVLDNVALAEMFGREQRDRATAAKRAMDMLDFVNLAEKAHRPVGALNLHERKFLEMARALALEPQLLLLDEVLAGLNPSEVELGIKLIRRIRDQGVTLIFVEHNLRAVMELSDRMVVLNYGRKIAEGDPDKVIEEPDVIEAYLGGNNA